MPNSYSDGDEIVLTIDLDIDGIRLPRGTRGMVTEMVTEADYDSGDVYMVYFPAVEDDVEVRRLDITLAD